MYIPAYIVFNLFDWGISLELLRHFKVYNQKGTQTYGQAGWYNLWLQIWKYGLRTKKCAHLRDHS